MIACLDGWMVEWLDGWLNVERSCLPRSIGEIPPMREMIERLNFKRVRLPRLYASFYNRQDKSTPILTGTRAITDTESGILKARLAGRGMG
jgi:hypothetical protein